VTKTSTPQSIKSLELVDDVEFSSDDMNDLADILARMIYRNLVAAAKTTPVPFSRHTKEGTQDDAPRIRDK
jgi:hypothetical protein